ncbi:MAG: 1-deoxy-D-xylulose-5-phosphate reductoisomerase [Deltaproteobacteria bacterium]|nr:1-deoxy-D-xylulose-5-phosphate reductoisomerase [Deltaproteobacteria bacterium]
MKRIAILGSTGSIGVQTLDVVRRNPDLFRVEALAAGSRLDLLEGQVREFQPSVVSVADEAIARELKQRLADHSPSLWIGHSAEGLERAATLPIVSLVVGGLPGSAGLLPTFAAVNAGKDVALATKEVLVMAGSLFMETVRRKGVKLLPVDSEQSAIFQCLEGNQHAAIRRLILTASGGPFREMAPEEMAQVTVERTLEHPRWKMGPKVTVDSATLMNKGFEVIEARWLFDVSASRIEVVIHPQSICHSMVEFEDGSILAQLGATDMRIPISYALAYPERIDSGVAAIDFAHLGSLTFRKPDWDRFPLLRAAYSALDDETGASSIILNAADEVAVELFLSRRIGFMDIPRIVLDALNSVPPARVTNLEEIKQFHSDVVTRVQRNAVA